VSFGREPRRDPPGRPRRSGRPPGAPGRPKPSAPDGESGHRALRQALAALLAQHEVEAQVSPGFYFQRCLPIWERGLVRTRKEKAVALRPLVSGGNSGVHVTGEPALPMALVARQGATWDALAREHDGVELRLRGLVPFVTGIGQPHPLETGFAFLKPYGVPYLAGAGVKGAVRSACREVWRQDRPAQVDDLLRHYFGSDEREALGPPAGPPRQRGALWFLDLFPEVPSWERAFRADVVNPHYGPYYAGSSEPADWHTPKPSFFLTLHADLEWRLRLLYAPLDAARADWWAEIGPGVRLALTEGGLGAKKSWGYGLFTIVMEHVHSRGAGPGVEPGADAPPAQESPGGRARPAVAAPPGPRPLVAALSQLIDTLKAKEVPAQLSRIERDLREATAEERDRVIGQFEARLRSLGFKAKDVARHTARLRAGGGGPPA
jgi:CRISPR type III-B/RAMP module RAMP protein Cmr6